MTVEVKDGSQLVLEAEQLQEALQYSPTSGLPDLVSRLWSLQEHVHSPPSGPDRSLCVSTGSQDALSKCFDALLDESRSVLVESPCYSGALAHLKPLGCNIIGVETDSQGLVPSALERAIDSAPEPKPRVLYTIPTGSNPSGSTLSLERRRAIYDIARRRNLIILEDDPYYFLSFSPTRTASFLSMDEDNRVVRFDSVSKLISSGMRIGWVTGPRALVERIELHSQSNTLHTSGISQALFLLLLRHWGCGEGGLGGFQHHVESVVAFYKSQKDQFMECAERHLSGKAEWAAPEAGMFVWFRLLDVANTDALIKEKAVEQRVVLVPGSAFHPQGLPGPFVRAAFSTATADQMDEALRRFSALL